MGSVGYFWIGAIAFVAAFWIGVGLAAYHLALLIAGWIS